MRCWADVETSCEVDGRVWGVGGSSGGGGGVARERCGVEGNTCVHDELTMMKMWTRVRADESFFVVVDFFADRPPYPLSTPLFGAKEK